MAKSKKKLSGEGWSFIPAGGTDAPVREVLPAEKQRIRVIVEKRAKGKIMTVASGFALSETDLKALGKELKKLAGGGGSAKDDTIEVQGDHLEKVKDALRSKGFGVR